MSDTTRISTLETTTADIAASLDELRSALASHDSALGSIRLAELEQKISPSLTGPGPSKASVGSDTVANTLGNVQVFAGHLSLLLDPALDSLSSPGLADDATYPLGRICSADFADRYHLNSGATPTYHWVSYTGREWSDITPGYGGAADFNSAHMNINLDTYTGACDETITLECPHSTQNDFLGYYLTYRNLKFPYLVGGIKLCRFTEFWNATNLTSYTAVAYLVKNPGLGGEAILATSETVDVAAIPIDVGYHLVLSAPSAGLASGDTVSLRLVLHPVVSGASASTNLRLTLAEPQLHFAYTPDLLPFAPYLARWQPYKLKSLFHGVSTDLVLEVGMRYKPYEMFHLLPDGTEKWGSGDAARDVRLARSAANRLTLDDTAGGGAALVVVPSASQALAAGTALLANANIVQFTCTGAVTTSAAPTVADGVDGQTITVINVGSGTWTIKDQGTLADSNLRLFATAVAIGPRQSLQLMYSTTVGDWVQVGVLVLVI